VKTSRHFVFLTVNVYLIAYAVILQNFLFNETFRFIDLNHVQSKMSFRFRLKIRENLDSNFTDQYDARVGKVGSNQILFLSCYILTCKAPKRQMLHPNFDIFRIDFGLVTIPSAFASQIEKLTATKYYFFSYYALACKSTGSHPT